jgi:protein-disulfide isomerase
MAKESFSLENVTQFIGDYFGAIFLAVLFFVGGFFVGSLWTENKIMKSGTSPSKQVAAGANQAEPSADENKKFENLPKISDTDHFRGAKEAKLYLIEYSDYECPFCQKFHPTMEQIMEEYGDQITWVFRHYPLSFHPNAKPAAEAAECIADRAGNDAFWTFTDTIFDKNKELGGKLSPEAIKTAIIASGANLATIEECVDSGEMSDVVTAHFNGGAAAGISGTPGTIIMTAEDEYELISGALPFEQVKQVIEKYL